METSSSASSSANIIADIIRLIPPTERAAFRDMLAHETRGRVLVCTENLILIDYVIETPTRRHQARFKSGHWEIQILSLSETYALKYW